MSVRYVRAMIVPILAAVMTVWLGGPAGGATIQAGGSRPAVWSGTAGAAGAHVVINTDPSAVPVATLIDLRIPDAASEWDSSGTATARASSIYPGATGTGGLQLLCDFGAPCPAGFPPSYPLTAFASHPNEPDASTATGFGKAHAGTDLVASSARPGNVLPTEQLAQVVTVGSSSALTRQEFVDGTLTVTSATHLTDVTLGGGALRIASLDVTSVSVAPTGAPAETRVVVAVAGVETAQGQVIVDQDGARFGGQGTDGQARDQLNGALAQALDGTGLSARFVGAHSEGSQTTTSGHGAGLTVSMEREVSGPAGVPGVSNAYRTYLAHVTLGQVATRAYATNDAFAIDSADITVPAPPPASSGSGTSGGSSDLPAGTSTTGGTASGFSTAPPASGGAPLSTTGTSGDAPPAQAAPPATDAGSDEQAFQLLTGSAASATTATYGALAALAVLVLTLERLMNRRVRPFREEPTA